MILVKNEKEVIQGVSECVTLTLELQTPYGEEPHSTMILEYIKKELPFSSERVQNRISYLPLISFNSSMGRTHRFLVAFSLRDFSGDRSACDRVLPLGIAYTAFAEQEMLKNEGYDNLICGGYLEGDLYLLIFCEGRLVHWIQERIEAQTHDLNRRLHRLQLFIQQDSFLSRLRDCPVSILSEGEILSFFEKAVRDPFWKHWDLDPCIEFKERAWKRLQRRFRFAFVFLFVFFGSFFFLNQFIFSSKERILAQQEKDQRTYILEQQKILAFQHEILSLKVPLDLDLILREIGRVLAQGTTLKSLKKIPSEEGAHLLLHFSAIHFEEASRLKNQWLNNPILQTKRINVGQVQSTAEGRVIFQMELFL